MLKAMSNWWGKRKGGKKKKTPGKVSQWKLLGTFGNNLACLMEIWVSPGKPVHQVRINCCAVPKLHRLSETPRTLRTRTLRTLNSLGSSVHAIFPGKNTEVDCHFLLQGLFPTKGSNSSFLHCRGSLYHWITRQVIKESTVPWVSLKLQMEIPRTHSKRFWCKSPPSSSNVHLRLGVPGIVVQSLSCIQLFVTLWTAAQQASLSHTISWSLLKLMSIESVMSSSRLIHCHLLLLLPSVFPSIEVFSRVGSLHQVAKVLELQLQHQYFQWIFRIDFL